MTELELLRNSFSAKQFIELGSAAKFVQAYWAKEVSYEELIQKTIQEEIYLTPTQPHILNTICYTTIHNSSGMLKTYIDKFIDFLTNYLTGNEEVSRLLILVLVALSVLISGYVVFANNNSKRHYISLEDMTSWEREAVESSEAN